MEKNTSAEKITFFRRVWKSGKAKHIISVPEKVTQYYDLEGKFVKVTLEVLGAWKESKSQENSNL